MSRNLVDALVKFDREVVLKGVRERLDAGEHPMEIVRDLQEGMKIVGDRFSKGEYFLGELMMSADLFSKAMAVLEPRLEGLSREKIGAIVIGTPKGDIHDLGKNLFCTVAKGAGFEVHDLGIDVAPSKFLETIEKVKPQIVGFSALITTAFQPMKQVVDALVEKGMRDGIKVIIGGGVTTDTVRRHVGADAQTTDAVEGIRICKELIGR